MSPVMLASGPSVGGRRPRTRIVDVEETIELDRNANALQCSSFLAQPVTLLLVVWKRAAHFSPEGCPMIADFQMGQLMDDYVV